MANESAKYDVVIVGGGPAGLSPALARGRGRKRVLLCDAGARRNAAAEHIQNFVTRDGTPPGRFREIGREQLATYPNVQIREARIQSISGAKGAFGVQLDGELVEARRVLLCIGMVDEMLPIEGFAELWGRSIFQCPYCHGWEVQDRRWGYLPRPNDPAHVLPFALMIRGWTRDVTLFTGGALELPPEATERIRSAGIRIETAAVSRLAQRDGRLESVVLASGEAVPCDALFTHPPQRQLDLVRNLDLALDNDGCVVVDPMMRETSVPGIYAAGDLTTRMQGAVFAAASGTHAAASINAELTMDLVSSGKL